ncbi:MAG: cache domain-containing protein [Candidatus Eisenbacteria bacterium]|nr:cache domain-containing protein [Candidatus Eisenbacteria bacterium]
MPDDDRTSIWNGLHLRIFLPVFASLALFTVAAFLFILPQFEESLRSKKMEMVREQTAIAWSVIDYYVRLEQEGTLTREAAQKAAMDHVRHLRYGPEKKDYFWINDMHPTMLMHPYRTDMDGTDMSDYADPNGKLLVVEMVRIVRERGEGFVDYMWQWKDDPDRVAPKISYVKGCEAWGWIVGTGLYVEDERREITAMTRRLAWVLLAILGVVVILLLTVIRNAIATETRRREAEKSVRRTLETMRATLEGLPFAVVLVDRRGTIRSVNEAALALLERTEGELIGRSCRDTFCSSPMKECPVLRGEESIHNREGVVLDASGGSIPVLKSVLPLLLDDEELLLETFVDITERKSSEEELKRHMKEISEAKHRLEILVGQTVERETRMVQLKAEVNGLLDELDRPAKYKAPERVAELIGGVLPAMNKGD